ncbi:hypothetical protein DY926_15835 [Komagataeibacter melaceti]|uniref:Transposase DDE domain-containing protein n=1 Tax=Komagataeibacter melaceti TaxID=2766577 RepID=A0A371YWH8_9PROT|nr:hypothetical protein DY926_15835 [Komagataeibacter melaceti]
MLIKARQIAAVIPSRRNRYNPRKPRFSLYRKRNETERFFARLRLFRGIATRYDKTS